MTRRELLAKSAALAGLGIAAPASTPPFAGLDPAFDLGSTAVFWLATIQNRGAVCRQISKDEFFAFSRKPPKKGYVFCNPTGSAEEWFNWEGMMRFHSLCKEATA